SLGLGVGATKTALGVLGREIFEDRRRFPEDEAVLFESWHPAVGVLGEKLVGARLADARIDRHLVQRNAELGREQADFARMRRGLEFVKGDDHGVSFPWLRSRTCVPEGDRRSLREV